MASIILKTSSFEIKLPVVQIEWDMGIEKLEFKLYDIQYHEREVIKQILKNKIPSLWGTNHPSCCHAIDIVIEDHTGRVEFPQFTWGELEDEDNWLRCKGWYRKEPVI